MATEVRYEFVTLGTPSRDGSKTPLIRGKYGTPGVLTVTGTATTAGSRPVAPAGESGYQLYARLTALNGNVIAEWGADPTATASNGVCIPAGVVEAVPVTEGEKISFIEQT